MNIAYKLFHLPRDHERNKLVENVHSNLLKSIKILDTDTIKISSYDEYIKFKDQYPDFNIDINATSLNQKKFLDSDYDYLILMEDDIVLYDNFLDNIKDYLIELPNNFDAFHVFYPGSEDHKYNTGLDISNSICSSYQDWSCACYIINKSGAKKMIELASKGISLPLDWFMFRQKHALSIYTVKPTTNEICTVLNIQSTFQAKEDRKPLNGIL